MLAPGSTLVIAAIFLYGALFSRFRLACGLIALSGPFFLFSQLYWLVIRVQQSSGLILLSKEAIRALFPIQAFIFYLGVPIVIIGDILSV